MNAREPLEIGVLNLSDTLDSRPIFSLFLISPFYTDIPQYWYKEDTSISQLWLFILNQIKPA